MINLSKPFKSYFVQDAVYKFVNSMIEEGKDCADMMKNHFNEELVMIKEDDEYFENSTNCLSLDNVHVDGDVILLL